MVNEKKHTFQNKIFSFESFSNHLTDKTFKEFGKVRAQRLLHDAY